MAVWDNDTTFLFDCSAISSYDFSIKFLRDTDFEVYLADQLTQEETKLELNRDYTITKNLVEDGGTITLSQAHPGYNCFGKRVLELIQPEEIPTEGYFPEETIENALDRSIMIDQQLQAQLDRVPKLNDYTQFANLVIEEPQDGKMLIYEIDENNRVHIKASDYAPEEFLDEMKRVSEEANENLIKVLEAMEYVQSVYDNMLFYERLGSKKVTIDNNAGYLFFEKLGSTQVTVEEKATMLFSEKYNDDQVVIELENGVEELLINVSEG